MKKILISAFILAFLTGVNSVLAADVNLSSPQWLGNLKLNDKQLKDIKDAVEKALKAPVDAEQQCGEVRGDCVVRAAREWTVGKELYREIVIAIHTIGHTSHAVGQAGGKWPNIKTK